MSKNGFAPLAPITPYVLATGEPAVRRLHVQHDIYAPAGRRVLLLAGLTEGMRVADFGCGVGVMTRMLAEIVGPCGHVTGIDINRAQLQQARELCAQGSATSTSFVEANACSTGLPRNLFDLVYCRFLLLHLPDPAACLREMREVLRPGGIIVVEDGDLATAFTLPPTAMNDFSTLFSRLGSARGVDYSVANNLYHMVMGEGFSDVNVEIHQPVITHGKNRHFLKWSVEEAGPALVTEGIVTPVELSRTLSAMHDAAEDPRVLVLPPRMSMVWARKSVG